jgi:light-regulated signal transduction histidine kinase (bacteriophytochrome)
MQKPKLKLQTDVATRGDASYKKTQADMLLRSNARLEEFAYAVAHDLREPLRTVSMFAELLDATDLPAEGAMLAQLILRGVARISTLFDGLHAFAVSGLEHPPVEVDLAAVAANVSHDLTHQLRSSGATVCVGPLPRVLGNKNDLERVFQNLIMNAIKYRGEAPASIQVSAERTGTQWTIRVKDNGVGIAPAYLDQIFILFKRLHGPETPGAGIGLAICRKIIEAGGERMWVESALGVGSVFFFSLTPAPVLSVRTNNTSRARMLSATDVPRELMMGA